jgi:hypothetical protein
MYLRIWYAIHFYRAPSCAMASADLPVVPPKGLPVFWQLATSLAASCRTQGCGSASPVSFICFQMPGQLLGSLVILHSSRSFFCILRVYLFYSYMIMLHKMTTASQVIRSSTVEEDFSLLASPVERVRHR